MIYFIYSVLQILELISTVVASKCENVVARAGSVGEGRDKRALLRNGCFDFLFIIVFLFCPPWIFLNINSYVQINVCVYVCC